MRGLKAFLWLLMFAIPSGSTAWASPRFIAFHAPWDAASAASLAAHGDALDVVITAWVSVVGDDHALTTVDDPAGHAALTGLRRRPHLWIMVQNARLGAWDGAGAAKLVQDQQAANALIAQLDAIAVTQGADGIVFDLESLPADALPALVTFLRTAREQAHRRGLTVAVTVPVADPAWDLPAIAGAVDRLILMAYDEHWQTGAPGPIASRSWFESVTVRALAVMSRSKAIVAIAAYGYDWPATGPAAVVSVERARALALSSGVTPQLDPASGNRHFSYRAFDGMVHEVWFMDADAAVEQIRFAERSGASGAALWRLGTEDHGLWAKLPGAK